MDTPVVVAAPSPRKLISSPNATRKGGLSMEEVPIGSSPNALAQKELMGLFSSLGGMKFTIGKEEEDDVDEMFMEPSPPVRSINPHMRNSPFLIGEFEPLSPYSVKSNDRLSVKKLNLPPHVTAAYPAPSPSPDQEDDEQSVKLRSYSAPVSPRARYESM